VRGHKVTPWLLGVVSGAWVVLEKQRKEEKSRRNGDW
jgi:hypothetical protein